MSLVGSTSEQFDQLEPSSAVAVRLSVESYLDVIRALVENFAPSKNLDIVYICSSIPSESIIQVLNVLEASQENIYFIDCISHIMMGASLDNPKVIYIESPTMLETIMLKVEYLMRRLPNSKKVVVIDSINTLSIHNDTKILSEFFHILVNNLRSREAYTLIFDSDDKADESIGKMMALVCDNIIEIEPTKEG